MTQIGCTGCFESLEESTIIKLNQYSNLNFNFNCYHKKALMNTLNAVRNLSCKAVQA